MYFDKKRGVALGIATAGSGIGAFIFSPLLTYTEAEYGWRGAVLITSGLCLHLFVCGLVIRLVLTLHPLDSGQRTSEDVLTLDPAANKEGLNTNHGLVSES